MARFLFATQPVTGHVVPAVGIVKELVRRGHEVGWYAGEKFRPTVEAAGARFEGYREAYDYDDADYDAAFPGRTALKGLNQIKFDFLNLFAEQAGPQPAESADLLERLAATGEPVLRPG